MLKEIFGAPEYILSTFSKVVRDTRYLIAVCVVLTLVFVLLLMSDESGDGSTLAAQVFIGIVLLPFIGVIVAGVVGMVLGAVGLGAGAVGATVGVAASPFAALGLGVNRTSESASNAWYSKSKLANLEARLALYENQ